MSTSAQPTTVKYLSTLFEDLDKQWIEELVSNYPTSAVEFLTEQCVERCQQINAEKQKNENNNNHNSNEKHRISDLQLDKLNFLYSGHIDSDDDVIMESKMTDKGPSISLIANLPKEINDWFEPFSKDLPIHFHPGLIEIMQHLQMIQFNSSFALSPKYNAINHNNNDNLQLIKSLDYLINLLKNVITYSDDSKYRILQTADDPKFQLDFLSVGGAEILLKYCGWTRIETEEKMNESLYLYDDDANDEKYLNAVIQTLEIYKKYLGKNDILSLKLDNNDEQKKHFKFDENEKKNDKISIFEDDDNDILDDKLLIMQRQDSYLPTLGGKIGENEQKICEKIEKSKDEIIDVPTHLNLSEYLLYRRCILYGANANIKNVNFHQWPPQIPAYALIEEHKKNNVNIYTFSWDEFPSHTFKYLAMECELNKFARITLSVQIGNCSLNEIESGSQLDDVQIFLDNFGKIQVLSQLGPYEKKLLFIVKYKSNAQLSYTWKYSGLTTTLQDIMQYVENSNAMFTNATEKYLALYQKYNLHKVADNVSSLHNILQNKLKVQCFVDLEFPPLTASLMTKIDSDFEDRKAFEGLIWKRLLDFADYPNLFGPITLSDIEQGKLGNCGFAASLTAISVYPELIKKLFLFPKNSVSSIGLYELRLCHNGIWRHYTIDDLIPCNYYGTPAFTKHENDNILWVSLIEKCAAKSYGGYDRLIAFCKLNAFNDLTGCPVEQIDFDIFDDANGSGQILWKYLMEWTANKYIVMTLAATMEQSKKSIYDLGIKGNHAFTFLRAVQIENYRLIQVRNPWGKIKDGSGAKDRWTGKYSRYNSYGEWTQTLKDIIQPGLENDDGTFWMELNDFQQYFRSASLCHLLCLDVTYKILRMNTKIVYNYDKNKNVENVSYPKCILDLTGGHGTDKMDIEWVGLQQENLRSVFAKSSEYLDCCLLIGQLKYPNDASKCLSDNPSYIQPIAVTECRKSKSEFEKVFVSLARGQKYVFIPYSTGIVFHKNFKKLKQCQTRNVNVSMYIKSKNDQNIQNDENIKIQYQKSLNTEQIKPILTHFVETLGTKKQNGDLEYIEATFGCLAFTGIRHTKIGKIMRGTFSFDLVNALPAIGFDQGFILKNNICKNEVMDEQKDDGYTREWKWIYTLDGLNCMETNLFVLGQYERFKRQKWRFLPEIYFSSIGQQQHGSHNHHNQNNGNAMLDCDYCSSTVTGTTGKYIYVKKENGINEFYYGDQETPDAYTLVSTRRRSLVRFQSGSNKAWSFSPYLCAMMIAALTMLWQTTFRVKK